MQKYKCSICGYVYDESLGDPEKGIKPGTKWEVLDGGFVCPLCGAPKAIFKLFMSPQLEEAPTIAGDVHVESIIELSAGEISAICSNLAKGCEKQRLLTEMDAFNQIAAYFRKRTAAETGKTLSDAAKLLEEDFAGGYAAANSAANAAADRGALRSLVWSEKVGSMMKSLLERFAREGEAMLASGGIYVCDICGFIYLGDTLPEICPVCKVPNFKITRVERRESYAGI